MAQVECQNCEWTGDEKDALPLEEQGIFDRVSPGEIMPVGECPECRAVVHFADEPAKPKPRIVVLIEVSGGLVESVDVIPGGDEAADVYVVDHDTDGSIDGEVPTLKFIDGKTFKAWAGSPVVGSRSLIDLESVKAALAEDRSSIKP